MLPNSPSPVRRALNRITFGARDADVARVNAIGLQDWLAEQLNAPPDDDPELAGHLATQTMPIRYAAADPATSRGTWQAVDEIRPLNYVKADISILWPIITQAGTTFSPSERARIRQELLAATWIRNAHSRYQVREFMTDFWHNHFNIGKNENETATALLAVYDREAIRPNALGNFRTLLQAVAMSPSMLLYLDNASSTAQTPNENYAREMMELHTLGARAYLGIAPNSVDNIIGPDGIAIGYTDQDVIQASRALSGWTIQQGQLIARRTNGPSTGKFFYNAYQHNPYAGKILNVNFSGFLGDMEQGTRLLDLLANHPSTAVHVATKLCVRIFGDTPPQAVIDRAVAAWNAYKTSPKQIQRVLEAIVTGGTEIMTLPAAKVRRPYERMIAQVRTTNTVINAAPILTSLLDPLSDGLFAWQAPDGRPDINGFWLSTGATLATWNNLLTFPGIASNTSTIANQTPLSALNSATGVVEHWVDRMIGHALAPATMTGLVTDQGGSNGLPAAARSGNETRMETAARRLVGLIAATEEFTYR